MSPTKQLTAPLETLFDFGEAMKIEILNHAFTEEEALQFDQDLELVEEEQQVENSAALGMQQLHNELVRCMSG